MVMRNFVGTEMLHPNSEMTQTKATELRYNSEDESGAKRLELLH